MARYGKTLVSIMTLVVGGVTAMVHDTESGPSPVYPRVGKITCLVQDFHVGAANRVSPVGKLLFQDCSSIVYSSSGRSLWNIPCAPRHMFWALGFNCLSLSFFSSLLFLLFFGAF